MKPANEQDDNHELVEKFKIWAKKYGPNVLNGIWQLGVGPYFSKKIADLNNLKIVIHACEMSEALKMVINACGETANTAKCKADLEKIISSETTNLANIWIEISIGIGVISLFHEAYILYTIFKDIERIQETVVKESNEAYKTIEKKIAELKLLVDKLQKLMEVLMRPGFQSKRTDIQNHLVLTLGSANLKTCEITNMIGNLKLYCENGIASICDKKTELNSHIGMNIISGAGSIIQLGLMASVANPLLLIGLGTVACAQLGMACTSYGIKKASNAQISKITREIENVELLSLEVKDMISGIEEAGKFYGEQFPLGDLDIILNEQV